MDYRKNSAALLPVVAAVLVRQDGTLLVQQRPQGRSMAGLWEFPGGKVEPGENPEEALIRELSEELGVGIAPGALAPLTFASEPLADRHLLLLLYMCSTWQGEPQPLHAASLRWVTPAQLHDLAMPPADIPLIAWVERFLG